MYSKDIALLVLSFSMLTLGVAFFVCHLSLDTEILKMGVIKVFSYSCLLGFLGFLIGSVLDYANSRK